MNRQHFETLEAIRAKQIDRPNMKIAYSGLNTKGSVLQFLLLFLIKYRVSFFKSRENIQKKSMGQTLLFGVLNSLQ